MLKYLWLSGLIIVLDQVSKWVMVSWLSLYETVAVIPYFNLTMAHNTGAAFSFLAGAGGWQRWFFVGLAVVISIGLFIWLHKLAKTRLEAISISLILGGAIGNVIDRLYFGYVIDFLDVYYGTYHWPAFNIADSAIVVGAALLIVDSFRAEPESDKEQEST
ncbi:MAG: signal peptidase II [Gammaproteobacteria bacterium]|nr:signal peptidase II [Gammaproteobacteria bacterium]